MSTEKELEIEYLKNELKDLEQEVERKHKEIAQESEIERLKREIEDLKKTPFRSYRWWPEPPTLYPPFISPPYPQMPFIWN